MCIENISKRERYLGQFLNTRIFFFRSYYLQDFIHFPHECSCYKEANIKIKPIKGQQLLQISIKRCILPSKCTFEFMILCCHSDMRNNISFALHPHAHHNLKTKIARLKRRMKMVANKRGIQMMTLRDMLSTLGEFVIIFLKIFPSSHEFDNCYIAFCFFMFLQKHKNTVCNN